MPIHILKLIERKEVAINTVELKFSKPEGFTFKAGQYGGFTLIAPFETDANGITRRFSILSAPHDPYISIVTRIQNSAYKRVLTALPIHGEIKFSGPTGLFTLHEDTNTPAVLIAGGIGIAPFHSILQTAAFTHSPQSITLFYGNQSITSSAYLSVLLQLEKQQPNFKCVPVMAHADPEWRGETGFITSDLLKRHISDLSKPIYYICGAPAMVTAIQEMLAELDIDSEKIRVEDFPGY